MQLATVIRELKLDDSAGVLEQSWRDSQASLPAGEIFFLTPESIAHACAQTRIPEQVAAAAIASGSRIAAHPTARALVWHFHYCLYQAQAYAHSPREWPSLTQALPEDGRMVYLLAWLSGVPSAEEENRRRGIPAEIVRESLRAPGRWLDRRGWFAEEQDGPLEPPWGLDPDALTWLILKTRCQLYRLGRLEHQLKPFDLGARVFRHRKSAAVLALCENGIHYRTYGGRAAGNTQTEPGTWTSRLVMTQEAVTGNPISPDGRALKAEVALHTADWEQVLAPGQLALGMHIPAGTPLGHQECGQSLRHAMEFFPRHFPDKPVHAFCCYSWLLDAELQRLLPETSNLVRFQREFYLVPHYASSEGLIKSVFGQSPIDPATAPRRTSLQRAILERLTTNEPLQPTGGGCFLLFQDFDWGKQVYLRGRSPSAFTGGR
ncbi:MAG: acyltransferase domain-containing protein [Armatimonadota bacterium]